MPAPRDDPAPHHKLGSGCRERLGFVRIEKTHDVKCAASVRIVSADAESCDDGSALRSVDSERGEIDGDVRASVGANRTIACGV